MTRQRIFNKVVKHLLKQGQRSSVYGECVKREICLYRDPEGRQCAVGCLIKDKFYDPTLEYSDASSRKVLEALEKSEPDININDFMVIQLLIDLQKIHDNVDPENWRYDLTALAEAEGFIIPAVLKSLTNPQTEGV